MSLHFNNDHPIENLVVTPLEKIRDDIQPREAESLLQQREELWISRLATLQPVGMNMLARDTQQRIRT